MATRITKVQALRNLKVLVSRLHVENDEVVVIWRPVEGSIPVDPVPTRACADKLTIVDAGAELRQLCDALFPHPPHNAPQR